MVQVLTLKQEYENQKKQEQEKSIFGLSVPNLVPINGGTATGPPGSTACSWPGGDHPSVCNGYYCSGSP